MYKLANKTKLRFPIQGVGNVSTEQLWSVTEEALIEYEEALENTLEAVKTSRRKRVTKTKEVEENELRLSIVTDVLNTREAERNNAREAEEVKKNNAEIDLLIFEKKKEQLKAMSIEDLEKLRK